MITKVKAEAEEVVAEQKAESEAEAEEAIAKVKAEAQETVAEQKAEWETEAEETIAKVKAEAEEVIAMVKAEAEEAVAEQKIEPEAEAEEAIGEVKAEAEEAIGEVKAEAEEAIGKVKAEAEEAIGEVEAEEKEATTDESKEQEPLTAQTQPVSETIQRMAQSPAVLPGEHSPTALALCAKDIMQKELVWGSPDDSVQQAFAKMQQHDVGYIMVGQEGVLEGIVSKSDLTGAMSTYLRPIFAKWRRPLDDATLQIKIKWIMNRPVCTIRPETSFATIVDNMRQLSVPCLPVLDQQGKVQGLVAEVNIFKALVKLNGDSHISASDEVRQGQPASITSSSPQDDSIDKDNGNPS
ncbi:MAG: CBS domain-containing protein [Planctomycetota bacterium]